MATAQKSVAEARPSWLDGGLEAVEFAREDGPILDERSYPLEGYLLESNVDEIVQLDMDKREKMAQSSTNDHTHWKVIMTTNRWYWIKWRAFGVLLVALWASTWAWMMGGFSYVASELHVTSGELVKWSAPGVLAMPATLSIVFGLIGLLFVTGVFPAPRTEEEMLVAKDAGYRWWGGVLAWALTVSAIWYVLGQHWDQLSNV